MSYLPLNLNRSYSENSVPITVSLPPAQSGQARIIYYPQGVFFSDDIDVMLDGNPLIENVDYLLSGYSKYLKHEFGLDGYGLVVILNDALTGMLSTQPTFIGGDFQTFDFTGIPEHVPLVGSSIAQIFWDDIVSGPTVSKRALTGVYQPNQKMGVSGIANIVNLLGDQALSDGPIGDRQTIRDIVIQNTTDLLDKVPTGLNTQATSVTGAINELRTLGDTTNVDTISLGVLYEATDLSGYSNTERVGWAIGVDGVQVTGDFNDGDSVKTLSAKDTVVYDVGTGKLHLSVLTPRLLATPLLDNTRPDGTTSFDNQHHPVQYWNDTVFKLIPDDAVYAGVISSIRGNTSLSVPPTVPAYYVVAEDNIDVTYATNRSSGPSLITKTLALGDIVYFDNSVETVVLKDHYLGWTPEYEESTGLSVMVARIKNDVDIISSKVVGEIFETYAELSDSRYLKLSGQDVSRTDYPELFKVLGTTFGSGDGNSTFGVPSSEPLSTLSDTKWVKVTTSSPQTDYTVVSTSDDRYLLLWGDGFTVKRLEITTGTIEDTGILGIPAYVPDWGETFIFNTTNQQLLLLDVSSLQTTIRGTLGGYTFDTFVGYDNYLFGIGSHIVSIGQAGASTPITPYQGSSEINGGFVDNSGSNFYFVADSFGQVLDLSSGQLSTYPLFNCKGVGIFGKLNDESVVLYDSGDGFVYDINPISLNQSVYGKALPRLSGMTSDIRRPDTLHFWSNRYLLSRHNIATPNQYIVAL